MAKRVRVTIKDVARVANVTPQTVSRAFRDVHDISEETRAKILKIAAEMGYVKNSTATSLRNGSSKLIAIVYDNLMNSYFSIITYYLQECLKKKGYSIMAISVTDTQLTESAYISAVEHNVDGIISYLQLNDKIQGLIKTYHTPVLVLGRKEEEKDSDCIYVDDFTIGKIAAQRFIQKGLKHPLVITEAMEITCSYDRYSGFKSEYEKLGITPKLIANKLGCKLRIEKHLLDIYKEEQIDSVFCFNDQLAFETLYVVEKNGLKTPSVIGVDNIQQEMFFPKRLTTVGWDKQDLAQRATDMMIEKISHPERCLNYKVTNVFLVEGVTA